MRQLTLCLLVCFSASMCLATKIHVPENQPTIQAGIDSAAAGDTVLVACGTYYEHDIVMKSGVCLRSETAQAACATIDAQQEGRCIICEDLDSNTIIEGFTFADGSSGAPDSGNGGGIYCSMSTLAVRSCTFTGNQAEWGGGIYASWCELELTGCTFSCNQAHGGGGVHDASSGAQFTGCTFFGNSATEGAAATVSGQYTVQTFTNTIIAFNIGEYAIGCWSPDEGPWLSCCNIFGNSDGDWSWCIAHLEGDFGNISLDPLFCDTAAGNLALLDNSPCLPENNTCAVLIGAFGAGCDPSSVEFAEEEGMPASYLILHQNYPNPFNPATTIGFSIPRSERVCFTVYDVLGRVVEKRDLGTLGPGVHTLTWDQRDDGHADLPSGVYHYQIQAGHQVQSRKMLLLK